MSLNRDAVWIAWNSATRNKSMASQLNVQLYEFKSNRGGVLRYIDLLRMTWRHLFDSSVRIVIITNPSVVLAFFALVVCRLKGKALVADTHNVSIVPDVRFSFILLPFCKFVIRFADLVIVTNRALQKTATEYGGRAVVAVDPLPLDFSDDELVSQFPIFTVFSICSWAADEPIDEIIGAAKILQSRNQPVSIIISGNFSRRNFTLPDNSSNVRLTGFTSEREFHNIFLRSNVIMDLTTRDNCLVCGAYEAVAANKPAILSDTLVNRNTFHSGVLYTTNNAESIAAAIEIAMLSERKLATDMETLHFEMQGSQLLQAASLKKAISTLVPPSV